MFYRLEIENFYSIRDKQVLDLLVGKGVKDAPEKFAPLFPGSEDRVPKVVAIFGANASGKTTILRALSFLKWFISQSLEPGKGWTLLPFNDEDSQSRPVALAIEFASANGIVDTDIERSRLAGEPYSLCRYEVQIEFLNGAPQRVLREALLHKPMGKGKWVRVFERDARTGISGSALFPLTGAARLIAEKARPDVSLVATLVQNVEHPAAEAVKRAAVDVLTNVKDPQGDRLEMETTSVFRFLANVPDLVGKLNAVLPTADVGIDRFEVIQTANGPELLFHHNGMKHPMHWRNQSQGTQSFIKAFLPISLALESGVVTIQDEIDSQVHPMLLREVVNWFYSSERNPLNAQIWMTSHSTPLLEELANEEVILCEKDHLGRTSIFSLKDVQGARRDHNLYRKYMSGVYGAVPHFG